MRIGSITPNFYQGQIKSQNSHYSNPVMPSKLSPLKADTVSFGNTLASLFRIEEAFRMGYDKNLPLYRSMGFRLMDMLKSIANKYASRGVSFDEDYCAPSVVKSTDSFVRKLISSGECPYDRIRATLFVENPYDFKLIREILDDFELRNYSVRSIPKKINGRKVSVPDFDIRLGGVTPEDTAVLGEDLAKCIGKPQKSGYEDIQMRLVDTSMTGKNVPPMEVLFLYGKNYAKAKHDESYFSYDIRRILDGRLHLSQIENPKANTPAYRVQSNIGIIGDILSNNIAKPLFFNAKNKDYLHESLQMPVELSKGTCDVLSGLLNGISNKITLHYRAEAAKIKSDDFVPELERLIKTSPEYIERKDKTIFIADIRKMRRTLLEQNKIEKEEDMAIMSDVRARLNETIKKYGKDI